jgi:hypothetical protein
MAGMVLPYFRVWAAETLSDSRFQSWDMAERGAFFTLLAIQWREGAVPADMTTLAKLLHVDGGAMRSLWSAIGDRFVPHPDHPGKLANPRMEEERDEALASVNQKKRAGKLGAESRWSKIRRANNGAMAVPCGPDADPMADDGDQSNGTEGNGKQQQTAAAAVDAEPVRRLEVVDEGGGEVRDLFPLTTRFRRALSDSLARTAPHPVGGGRGTDLAVFQSCERALAVLGVDRAVEVCRQRVLDAVAKRERQPATLKFFVDAVLGDELTRRASQPKGSPRVIGVNDNGEPIFAGEGRA